MDPIEQLREQRAQIIQQARDLLDAAEAENRDLNETEQPLPG